MRILVTIAVLAIPASAAATTPEINERVGGFDAAGTGTLVVNGNLTVFGNVTGSVIVRDRVGGAIVRIKGVRQRPRLVEVNGNTVRVYTLRKVSGGFYVKGRNVRVELRSPIETLSMTALGRGRVLRLDGTGTWHLNGGPEEQWSDATLPIVIAPPPPEPPEPTTRGAEATGTTRTAA